LCAFFDLAGSLLNIDNKRLALQCGPRTSVANLNRRLRDFWQEADANAALTGQAAKDAGSYEVAGGKARRVSFALYKRRENALPVAKSFHGNAERCAKLILAELHGPNPNQVWGEPQNAL